MARRLVIIVAIALLAVGCGGSSEVQVDGDPNAVPAPPAVTTARAVRVHGLAQTAIEMLGSDAAATEAVFGAIVTGYDGDQIEAGIAAGALQPDGTIADVPPAGPAVEVDFRLVGAGAQEETTLVERLRQGAQQLADGSEELPIEVVERRGTELILGLLSLGFTGEQVVEFVIFDSLQRGPLQENIAGYCNGRVDAGTLDLAATVFDSCAAMEEDCRQSYFIDGEQTLAPICPTDRNDVGRVEPTVERPTVDANPTVAGAIVDSGTTSWSGVMDPKPNAITSVSVGDATSQEELPVTYPAGFVEIERVPGTDEFSIEVDVVIESAKDYALSSEALQELLDADVIDGFEPNICLTTNNHTFTGDGTFEGDTSRSSYFIVFRGEDRWVENRDCRLEDLEPYRDVRPSEVWVEVTAEGLRVGYQSYEVVLPGPAAPLAG